MKKLFKSFLIILITLLCLTGCEEMSGTRQDTMKQREVQNNLSLNQATPTDIDYSLERYNLIKRAYWVNGQREKAAALPCQIQKPIGYIVLFTEAGNPVGNFVVDGKVTSLNSFLTSSYYYGTSSCQYEMADVDGSYGENDNGIFFFTTDGKYIEWTGIYLYSDIPFEIDCMLTTGEVSE